MRSTVVSPCAQTASTLRAGTPVPGAVMPVPHTSVPRSVAPAFSMPSEKAKAEPPESMSGEISAQSTQRTPAGSFKQRMRSPEA